MALTPGQDTKNYDCTQVDLIICGVPVSDGYVEDEFLSIKQNSDDYTLIIGADGSPVRSTTQDRSAIVEVNLMQTSRWNSIFATLRATGFLVPGGSDIAPFLIRDKLGTATYTAKECWIQKRPDVIYGKSATGRKWTICVPKLIAFDGGSP